MKSILTTKYLYQNEGGSASYTEHIMRDAHYQHFSLQ